MRLRPQVEELTLSSTVEFPYLFIGNKVEYLVQMLLGRSGRKWWADSSISFLYC
jgi:hypothetical protein